MNDLVFDYGFPDAEPRYFERMAMQVRELWPESAVTRTRDTIQIVMEDTPYPAIMLLFTPEAVEIRFQCTDWPHPGQPVPSSRLWRRIELDGNDPPWQSLLEDALVALEASYITCEDCGKRFEPEHATEMDGHAYCHGCAERNHGVVF